MPLIIKNEGPTRNDEIRSEHNCASYCTAAELSAETEKGRTTHEKENERVSKGVLEPQLNGNMQAMVSSKD